MRVLTRCGVTICVAWSALSVLLAAPPRRPLAPADVRVIAQLLKLEDTRQFDREVLTRLVKADHPEVRRRTVQAIGRIASADGKALLASLRGETDPEILATIAFSTGQLKDGEAVAWLGELLSSPKTPAVVGREAAQALGKIRTPEARTTLYTYLAKAPLSASPLVVGEALLSSGRFTTPGDLAPLVRWTSSPNVEIRWRATWALFRLRDPAAVPHLLKLADDGSGDVRFWAVRGLTPIAPPQARGTGGQPAPPSPPIEIPGLDRGQLAARLRVAVQKDPDRRVRTEALRALGQYDDDRSFDVVLAALDSPDSWLSVSAAEVMGRFQARAAAVVPKLTAAAAESRPTALRITALTPLVTLAPDAALAVATSLAHHPGTAARGAAMQALQRLGAAGKARLDELSQDPALRDVLPQGGGGRGQQAATQPASSRPDGDYRAIVERWIVSDYNGAPKPHAVWQTPKGEIELELYPGDAPLALEYFVRAVESGAIVGTEFGRVVPNFVAQQRTIRDAPRLRDEVSRRGLTRGNLAWASSGLDTGRPGYTLGSTPQPHNEGDFTALGRVVRGMDVVDRLEIGDAVTGARMVKK